LFKINLIAAKHMNYGGIFSRRFVKNYLLSSLCQ